MCVLFLCANMVMWAMCVREACARLSMCVLLSVSILRICVNLFFLINFFNFLAVYFYVSECLHECMYVECDACVGKICMQEFFS